MRRVLIGISSVLVLVSCTREPAAKSPLTERQRDSVIGASSLPGASGVRGALRIADSARARRARIDSAAREPQ